ncbi:phage protein, HK97 gp10 family [Pseudomonas asturiensis]|uniref:Phage protein, HK97 gp10 family n=1 Tax=Pseudomonas asturiensis TaxID=1190415 RepID=A0A1M7J0I8_9PSED|nr:HK97-gp10 family putative phage morphogenesis protein [Pseudomonas asturiensis]SHM46412.1 phage protein, HK97 gp10 family [Pseudomonas asturiensis]
MARRSRGDFKLRGLLRRIGNQMESDLRPAMVAAADLVLATQKELIPKDTHKAEETLKAFVSKSGLDAQIGIRGKRDNKRVFYAKFTEYGTKQYKFGDAMMAARPAHPWLRPSIDLNRDDIARLIRAAIQSTLAKAAGGVR